MTQYHKSYLEQAVILSGAERSEESPFTRIETLRLRSG